MVGVSLSWLVLEPRRWLVRHADPALYHVGSLGCLPCIRADVAVDSGMAGNIRPMLDGAWSLAGRVSRERMVGPSASPSRVCTASRVMCRCGIRCSHSQFGVI